jgi:hypothetical protein
MLVLGFTRRSFGPFVVFGVVFLLTMNVRYLIKGAPAAIAFFLAFTMCWTTWACALAKARRRWLPALTMRAACGATPTLPTHHGALLFMIAF